MSRPTRNRNRGRAVREAIRASKAAQEGRMEALSDLLISAKPAALNPAVFREALSDQARLILQAGGGKARPRNRKSPSDRSMRIMPGFDCLI